MRGILAIIIFCLQLPMATFCQTAKLAWVKQPQGPSFDAGIAIAVDAQNNVYATGYFSGTTDFDPGPGVANLTAAAAEDAFISKSDALGNLIWVKRIGDFRYQAGFAITLDATGNVYVTGIFFGNVDFDPGPRETILRSSGNEDVFICKLSNNGNFIWAKKIGGPANDYCNAVITDAAGNVYISGYFEGTCNFNTDGGVTNLISNGATDIYVCKLSGNSGSLLWASSMGGVSSDAAYGIGLDNAGNVYAAGFFFNTIDFDPGPATFNVQASGFGDGYIVKLTNTGTLSKAIRIGGDNVVRCTNLKVDAALGIVLISGYCDGTADFDPGPGTNTISSAISNEEAFVASYNLNLELNWVSAFTGTSFQRAVAIDTDEAGNVYTTGYYDEATDFNPGTGSFILPCDGLPDVFVSKLTGSGNFVWAVKAGGNRFEGGSSIKVNKAGDIFLTGTFNGTTDFDPGTEQFNLTAKGESEIFLMKLRQCFNTAVNNTVNINTCASYTIHNKTFDSSGTYIISLLNAAGCDSVLVNLNLTINRIKNIANIAICEGASWLAGGKPQVKSGTYYDTLRTATGCDSVIITNLTVNPLPKPQLGADRNLCKGQALTLTPGVFDTYNWQDNTTAPAYNVQQPGTYTVTVTDNNNCKATTAIKIKKEVLPPVDFLPATVNLCKGNVVVLSPPLYTTYQWNDGSTAASKTVDMPGIYAVSVVSADGCAGADTTTVVSTDCIVVGIPNAFTPNANGNNDFFRPVINRAVAQYRFQVFNRSGKKIFETNTPSNGWDGTYKTQPMPQGSYVYLLQFTTTAGLAHRYTGSVLLLR
jgi:gliding motility-associated-like protein